MPEKPHSIGTTEDIQVLSHDKQRTTFSVANNHASAKIYWGRNRGVTVANGFPIFPNTVQTFSPLFGDDPTKEIWLISDTAATDVRVTWELKK